MGIEGDAMLDLREKYQALGVYFSKLDEEMNTVMEEMAEIKELIEGEELNEYIEEPQVSSVSEGTYGSAY